MTRLEICTLACQKLGRVNDSTLDLARTFWKRRLEMVWHAFLWNESMGISPVSCIPDAYEVELAPEDDRVLAVKQGDRPLAVISPIAAWNNNPGRVATSGDQLEEYADMSSGVARPKIWLFPAPKETTLIHILVKKKLAVPDTDEATAPIRGIDNALVAFVFSDLLQHFKQFERANMVAQEGTNLFTRVAELQMNQAAIYPTAPKLPTQ